MVDVESDRKRAESFVEETLFEAALKMSEYSRSANPIDSVEGFLDWMKAQRAAAASNATSAGGAVAGAQVQASSLGQAGPSGVSNQQRSSGGQAGAATQPPTNPTGQGSP